MKKLVVLVAIFFVSMVSTLDAQRTSESRSEHRENRTERSYSKADKHRGNKCGKKHKIKHKNHNRKMHKKAGFEGRAPRGDRKMKGNKERGVY
jgi:Ni/Co efflux regulator RcnB